MSPPKAFVEDFVPNIMFRGRALGDKLENKDSDLINGPNTMID